MKRLFLCLAALMAVTAARADEGMWLLPYLKKLNIGDMQAEGLKLSADQIYNLNGNALKDAIVIFGGGCTGEIVSAEGLILTNHHCGYGAIQQHSSTENDYLKNGFWAMSRAEEIPTPGLAVTFIRSIEDVTDKIVPHLDAKMSEKERGEKIAELTRPLTQAASDPALGKTARVQAMFGGNQYFLFVMQRYGDVRMVGAPPSSIGKFGGDTDNWMWPRHTGDFSVFRVYADKEGNPAAYSADNVPYQSPVHLKISLKGVRENDFAMIMGFPGTTNRYMTSWEIDQLLEIDNPIRIFVRGERQEILMAAMKASDKTRIQYASKYASSSNYWKNSIGKSRGLVRLGVKAQKERLEADFSKWLAADKKRQALYGLALPLIEQAITGTTRQRIAMQYLGEALMRGVEIVGMARPFLSLYDDQGALDEQLLSRLRERGAAAFKDYDPQLDRRVARRMLAIAADSIGFASPVEVDAMYDRSIFSDEQRLLAFLENPSREALQADPAVQLAEAVTQAYESHSPALEAAAEQFARGHRLWVAGLMAMQSDKKFYPDANFTIRLSYGQVLPYDPADGITYKHHTTLSGVMAKEDPANAYEFTVPERLKELYEAKDFGEYALAGDIPVNFLTNNDITGGNSGSPVLNGQGELLGLAFDGNWEAMSGDVAFEPALQRTIAVDIRYVLFIIDKYAGAKHLIDEMTLVR